MRTRFRFEKLEVWQEARGLNQAVYRLTKKFPRQGRFGITSQIRRAVGSTSSNIAEGSGRNSDKDFAHFLEQAYGSLMEVASVFFLALDEGYVTERDLDPLFDELEKLARRIASLNRSLTVEASKTPFARPMRSSGSRPPGGAKRSEDRSTLDSRL
jgi:four helix bundle protein